MLGKRLDRAGRMEEGLRVARHAQHAVARRRRLRRQRVMHEAPLAGVVEVGIAVYEARAADARQLVDARNVRASEEQVDARGAGLERGARVVERGRAGADDAHALAGQRREVDRLRRVRPARARRALRDGRHVRAAEPVAAGSEHDVAREQRLRVALRVEIEREQAVVARPQRDERRVVAHVQVEHAPIPAQIVHPLRARNLVERVPRVAAVLRFEPGAKRQRGQPERGAGKLLRRAQRIHARERDPRAFVAGRRAIDHALVVDAEQPQFGAGREPRHPAADDRDVEHAHAVDVARRHPRWRGQIEPAQILGEPRFECVE